MDELIYVILTHLPIVKILHLCLLLQLFFRVSPTRSQFFSSLEMTDRGSFFKDVEYFTQRLRENRMEIQSFYATHKLGNSNIVWRYFLLLLPPQIVAILKTSIFYNIILCFNFYGQYLWWHPVLCFIFVH